MTAPLVHGIDLAEVARVGDMIDRHGDRFLERCFTPRERAYCDERPKRRAEHYAARFAAKEAVLKAIGTGWSGGIAWTDVEVVRAPEGPVHIELHGEAAAIARCEGIAGWALSLTHTGSSAMASVIGWRTGAPPEN